MTWGLYNLHASHPQKTSVISLSSKPPWLDAPQEAAGKYLTNINSNISLFSSYTDYLPLPCFHLSIPLSPSALHTALRAQIGVLEG